VLVPLVPPPFLQKNVGASKSIFFLLFLENIENQKGFETGLILVLTGSETGKVILPLTTTTGKQQATAQISLFFYDFVFNTVKVEERSNPN